MKAATILSLDELQIPLSEEVRNHLSSQYKDLCYNDDTQANEYLNRVLQAMKRPPATTICRVNQIFATRQDVMDGMRQELQENPKLIVSAHETYKDVVCVRHEDSDRSSICLSNSRGPPKANSIFISGWPSRQKMGWPMTHRVIMCDRFCGEAVLRGSDIFVKGVLSADTGVQKGEIVAVYADIRPPNERVVNRGLILDNYSGQCVFLGLGTAGCSRSEMFGSSQGLAVYMSNLAKDRVGPCLPPLHGVLQDKMMLQNLPSIVVGHALDPQPHDTILDMCSAPGGKSTHLASLVRNQATIVACDKSRKKMVSARAWFESVGATCITPLAWDSTDCVERDEGAVRKSVQEILESAEVRQKDGLKNIKRFFPESFDRILLDPPCSALGLRPKLFIVQDTLEAMEFHAKYQRKFVKEAVALLKPGGIMTYSTCTIHMLENESMVRHVLDTYPCLELLPIGDNIGLAGLPGAGLNDKERGYVRRFDPSDEQADTMGFFLAKFRKTTAC